MIGDGWVLIANETADLADTMAISTQEEFGNLLGGSLVNFSAKGGYRDVSGRYQQWLHDNNAVAVLVRPDYYTYGIAKTQGDIEALVKRAIDHLS